MARKRTVFDRIEDAIAQDKGIALSHDDLLEVANAINSNAAGAKAHEDMLHALIERSPAHASYALH